MHFSFMWLTVKLRNDGFQRRIISNNENVSVTKKHNEIMKFSLEETRPLQ